MTGYWPQEEVDHINGQRSDNRWNNLREATSSLNSHNRIGVRGFYPCEGGFRAQIVHNWKKYDLGIFPTTVEAQAAYDAKARELYG